MKEVVWFRSTLDEISNFPKEVKREIGFALFNAQCGRKHDNIKPLKYFKNVYEIKSDFDTNTTGQFIRLK